jgi:hypothetical protein
VARQHAAAYHRAAQEAFMPRWFPVIFLAVGLACLLGAAAAHLQRLDFERHAVRVEARVVSLLQRRSNHGSSPVYAPVFRFTTGDGQVVRVSSSSAANPPAYEVGQVVPLLYDPEHPQRAEEITFSSRYLAPLLLLGLGLPFLGVGVAAWRLLPPQAASTSAGGKRVRRSSGRR